MKLLIHFQTSMVAPLKFRNGFHPTFYNGCNYLSMLGLKLNHVSKRGLKYLAIPYTCLCLKNNTRVDATGTPLSNGVIHIVPTLINIGNVIIRRLDPSHAIGYPWLWILFPLNRAARRIQRVSPVKTFCGKFTMLITINISVSSSW